MVNADSWTGAGFDPPGRIVHVQDKRFNTPAKIQPAERAVSRICELEECGLDLEFDRERKFITHQQLDLVRTSLPDAGYARRRSAIPGAKNEVAEKRCVIAFP